MLYTCYLVLALWQQGSKKGGTGDGPALMHTFRITLFGRATFIAAPEDSHLVCCTLIGYGGRIAGSFVFVLLSIDNVHAQMDRLHL